MSGTRRRALHPKERLYVLAAARGLATAPTAAPHCLSVQHMNNTLARAKDAPDADSITHAAVLALAYGDFTVADTLRPIDMDPKD